MTPFAFLSRAGLPGRPALPALAAAAVLGTASVAQAQFGLAPEVAEPTPAEQAAPAAPLVAPDLLGDAVSEPRETGDVGTLKHEHRVVVREGASMARVSLVNPVDAKLIAVPEARVQFLNLQGGVVTSLPVGESGLVDLSSVPPGTYAVVVRSNSAVMAFGLVVDRETGVGTNAYTNGEVVLNAAAVSNEAEPIVRALVLDREDELVDDVYEYRGYDSGLENVDTPLAYQPVPIAADGTVSGRVVALNENGRARIPRQTEVSLIRSGQIVASTLTDEDGRFRFAEAVPGSYGVVAAGADGFAVFGMMIESSDLLSKTLQVNGQATLPVAFQGGGGASVALVPNSAGGALFPTVPPPSQAQGPGPGDPLGAPLPFGPPPGAPAGGFAGPGGGFGGGVAGGGGGGLGGGGLGTLLGIGGLAAGIAALADDDDDVTIISPAAP